MGVTLGIVQILWQIYMLTCSLRTVCQVNRPRLSTASFIPFCFLFYLGHIIIRHFFGCVWGGVGGGKGLFSEFRQPTQSGFLEKGSPCEPLVFRRHLCFLSLGQVAHPLPESSSLPSTEDSMWFPGLPHQAAGHSQPGPPSLGKGSECLVFGVLVLCGFGVCPTADIFPLE